MPRSFNYRPRSAWIKKDRLDRLWRLRHICRCDYPLPVYLQPKFHLNQHMSQRVIATACINARARSTRIPVIVNWSAAISVLTGPDPDYTAVNVYPASSSK